MRFLASIFRIIAALVTLALYGVTAFSAWSGCIDPLQYAMPAVLLLAFPALIIATGAVALIWLVSRGRIMALCGLMAVIVSLPQLLLFSPVAHPGKAATGHPEFTLISYNICHGLDREYPERPGSRSFDYVMSSGADVVILQEMFNFHHKVNPNINDSLVAEYRRHYPYVIETVNHDMMALSKYPIRRLPTPFFYEVCYLFFDAYEVDVKGRPVTILNLHLTSYDLTTGERNVATTIHGGADALRNACLLWDTIRPKLTDAFRMRAHCAEVVRDYLRGIDGPVVVCGDFNDVPGSWAWRTVMSAGLRDAYAETALGPMTTFNAHNLYFHIDQMMYRGAIRPLKVWRGDLKSSDHYPIEARFELTE